MKDIPKLDLRDFRSPEAATRGRFAEELRDGLCTFGFVVLEGHAIAPELVRRVYGHFERFFAFFGPGHKDGVLPCRVKELARLKIAAINDCDT